MVSLTASWDDEDLPRKIREHFLVNFAEVRQFLQHLKNLRNREKPPVRDANSTVFSIGIDNLPRQFISQDSFEYLLGAYEEFRRFSNAVPYPDPTGEEAGIYLVRRLIVILAGRFITRSIYPLLLDRRFNRDAPVTVDVSDLFAVNERMEEELSALPQLPIQIRMMEVLLGPGVRDQFAKATELLQMTSRIFFNMMLAAYRLPEISACSLAFDAVLMCIVQCKDNAAEQVSEYRLRLQDMYAAISSFGDRREQTDFNRILEAATSSNAEVLWQLEGIKKLVEQCMHPRFCGVPKEGVREQGRRGGLHQEDREARPRQRGGTDHPSQGGGLHPMRRPTGRRLLRGVQGVPRAAEPLGMERFDLRPVCEARVGRHAFEGRQSAQEGQEMAGEEAQDQI